MATEMMDRLPDAVSILDSAWRFSYVNQKGIENLRQLCPDLKGDPNGNIIWDIVPGLIGTKVEREYKLSVEQQAARTFEMYYPPLERWYEIRCFPSTGGLLTYVRDITSQRYREQLVEMRHHLSDILSLPGRIQDILQKFVETLVDRLDAAFARVWLLNAQTNVLELTASAGLYKHLDGPHGKVPVGQFKIGRIAQNKEPHLSNDVPNDPHVSNQEWARREGMVAFAGYPLIVENRVLGVVALFSKRKLAQEIINDLSPLASSLAQFIERRHYEAALLDQTRKLRMLNQIGSKVAAQLDLPTLLQTITTEATALVRAQIGAFYYNAVNPDNDTPYLRLARSDPSEATAVNPLPSDTSGFGSLFSGQAIIRRDDLRTDPAPNGFAPLGSLAVASYLAAPVVSRSGEILGGLFFGHQDPKQFGPESEDYLRGISSQAAVAIDNAVLYGAAQSEIAQRKKAEHELAKAQESLRQHAAFLEARVAERTAKLEDSVQSMERFTYSIAHDLRAPLRGMAGLSYALMKDYKAVLDATAVDYTQKIIGSAKRMDSLIQDLLGYARLAQVEVPASELLLREEFSTVLGLLENEIQKSQAEIVFEEPIHSVFANQAVLEQVLINLFSNAIKFVAPNVVPHVRVWTEKHANGVAIHIQDNGIGIPEEHHERIFRVFERLHDTKVYPGSGIGLAIALKGVERMGGSLHLDSRDGAGSVFSITLPAGQTKQGDLR